MPAPVSLNTKQDILNQLEIVCIRKKLSCPTLYPGNNFLNQRNMISIRKTFGYKRYSKISNMKNTNFESKNLMNHLKFILVNTRSKTVHF